MTVNMCMKFQLRTLIDITQTSARKSEDLLQYRQQQNFLTVIQTISMRSNPIVHKPKLETIPVDKIGFGKEFKGEHNVWTVNFEFESEDQHSVEFLTNDFNLVPVILKLTETASIKDCVFITDDPISTNIIFLDLE